MQSASYADAMRTMRENAFSKWSSATADLATPELASRRIHDGLADVRSSAGLVIRRDAAFFCVGSCFARELEDAMDELGLAALTKEMFVELTKADPSLFDRVTGVQGRATAFLNRYNAGSMMNLMESLESDKNDDGLLYDAGDGLFHEYHFTRFLKPQDLDRSLRRRREIRKTYKEAAVRANVFVFTLGLCESFYDLGAFRYLNVTPDPRTASSQTIEFRFLSFEQNLFYLRRVIDAVRRINPRAAVVLTVSPVPLDVTFTAYDVVVANSLAKSTLVACAHRLTSEYDDCHYFPSFELVLNSSAEQAWLWDRKHVSRPMVRHIMELFASTHLDLGGAGDALAPASQRSSTP